MTIIKNERCIELMALVVSKSATASGLLRADHPFPESPRCNCLTERRDHFGRVAGGYDGKDGFIKEMDKKAAEWHVLQRVR